MICLKEILKNCNLTFAICLIILCFRAALTKQLEQLKEQLQSETSRLTSSLEEEQSANKRLVEAQKELESTIELLKKNLEVSTSNERQQEEEVCLLKETNIDLEKEL